MNYSTIWVSAFETFLCWSPRRTFSSSDHTSMWDLGSYATMVNPALALWNKLDFEFKQMKGEIFFLCLWFLSLAFKRRNNQEMLKVGKSAGFRRYYCQEPKYVKHRQLNSQGHLFITHITPNYFKCLYFSIIRSLTCVKSCEMKILFLLNNHRTYITT